MQPSSNKGLCRGYVEGCMHACTYPILLSTYYGGRVHTLYPYSHNGVHRMWVIIYLLCLRRNGISWIHLITRHLVSSIQDLYQEIPPMDRVSQDVEDVLCYVTITYHYILCSILRVYVRRDVCSNVTGNTMCTAYASMCIMVYRMQRI